MQPKADADEGGVKVVFDVAREQVDGATRIVAAAGYDVRPYYPDGQDEGPGRAAAGYTRMGAERPLRLFTDAEVDRTLAEFEALRAANGADWQIVGVDSWRAWGGGTAGDREPRVPPVPPVPPREGGAYTPMA